MPYNERCFVKANAFLDNDRVYARNALEKIRHLTDAKKFSDASDLIGQYFEWRLRGAQEPYQGCDDSFLYVTDQLAMSLKEQGL